MNNKEQLRVLRPHGMTAPGCRDCWFFGLCGGIQTELSLLDCFQMYCKCPDRKCDNVCPNKPDFLERLREVQGLRFDDLPTVRQRRVRIPYYVPLIEHKYCTTGRLRLPVVAVKMYHLFHMVAGRYTSIASSAADLRKVLNLESDARIILSGIEKDPPLERYWERRRCDQAVEGLARLGITLAIAPNFSHFLDVPRTDNLFNRKRQLICLSELSNAGVNSVPHLSAASADPSADWEFWRQYLQRNENVGFVAREFQTGNRTIAEGLKVLERMTWLQDQIRRPLHPIVIGGLRFIDQMSRVFSEFTLIDSVPFMNAVTRQAIVADGTRVRLKNEPTLRFVGIERQVESNVRSYASVVKARARHSEVVRKAV